MNVNNLDDIFKMFGYENSYESCNLENEKYSSINYKIDTTAGANNNGCKNANLDMPCGFQDIDPMFLIVIGEIVSNVISGKLPVNLANAFGNWLQLIAQVIATFNAQQQYQQSGPGRCYSPAYRNVDNPFCESDLNEGDSGSNKSSKSKNKRKYKNYSNDLIKVKQSILQLQNENLELKKEIEQLKNEIYKLK